MKRGITPPAAYVRTNRISCDPCRKRKLKCDRVKPCSTCQRRKIVDQCYQDDREEVAGDHHTPASSKRSKGTPSVSEVEGHSPPESPLYSQVGLEKIKEQFQTIATIAQQSTHTLNTLIGSMPQSRGNLELIRGDSLKDKSVIQWSDIADQVPSIKECEDLITFHFEKLSYYARLNVRAEYDLQWHNLLYGSGISRIEASIILTSLAMAAVMLPSRSPIKKHSREDQHRWLTLLGYSTDAPLRDEVADNSFQKILLIGMTSVYHLYEGRSDRVWETIGIAIRKGIVYGLYDERRKIWRTLTPLEKEYHRRLAWYSLSVERWQAFARRLPFALHQHHIYLGAATFDPDEVTARNYKPVDIVPNTSLILADGRLQTRFSPRIPMAVKFVHIELLGWCHEFLDNFKTMDASARYHQASLLDDVLGRTLHNGLDGTGVRQEDLNNLNGDLLDQCVEERQVEINMFIASIFFLRCMVTRQFLMDENAPSNLRFASLIYAQGILATIPSLTRLIKEGKRPIQITYNATFYLAAATTFTVVILGQDLYVESQSNVTEVDTTEWKNGAPFPKEQMDWLADNIFVTLEGLENLVQRENQTALVALQLLEQLCHSQSDLRALYLKRFKKFQQVNEGSNQPHQAVRQNETHLNHDNQYQGNSTSDHQEPSVFPKYGVSANDTHTYSNGSNTDRSNFHSVVMQSSPATQDSSLANPTNITFSDPWQTFNPLQPLSASSLLDAVLMDSTELDFAGSNSYADILASLLQESPPLV